METSLTDSDRDWIEKTISRSVATTVNLTLSTWRNDRKWTSRIAAVCMSLLTIIIVPLTGYMAVRFISMAERLQTCESKIADINDGSASHTQERARLDHMQCHPGRVFHQEQQRKAGAGS